MPVGKCRMRPAHATALPKLFFGRLQELRPADFLIALWRELGDDQLAPLVEQKVAVGILDEMNRAPAGRWHRGLVFPEAASVRRVEASQLTVAIDAVNMAALKNGRADDRMQRV